jgi:integrase
MFCRDPLSKLSLSGLTREALATFRDDRLKLVSSETVRQYLVILRQVLETARKEWGVPIIGNPLDNIKRPAGAKARTRRLQPTEFDRLRQALSQVRNSLVGDVIRFALETGMRRGELLQGQWVDVDWDARTLTIHMTKNGDPRTIPLSPAALTVLHALWAQRPNDAAIFPISANAVKLAWRRLCASAGIKNLRFHDLRHEAVSRFFELGLSVPEVQLISGHKDVRMLFRYTHLRASDVARKMATGPLMELSTQRDRI